MSNIFELTVPVLMYHEVSAGGPERQGKHHLTPLYDISIEAFESQIKWLTQHGFSTPVVPRELSGHASQVMLTFDDGLAGNFHNALPILLTHGCRAVFFIAVGAVGTPNYMSWEELRRLRDSGMSVQSHALTHRPLENLGDVEIQRELRESKRLIETELGTEVDALSVPHGSYDRRVLEVACKLGYRMVFTSDPRFCPAASFFGKPAVLGRVAVTRKTTLGGFKRLVRCNRAEVLKIRAAKAAKNGLKRAIGIENYRRLYRRYFNIARPDNETISETVFGTSSRSYMHRVLQLISSTGFYGAENVVLQLADQLRKQGHVPVIGTLSGNKGQDDDLVLHAQEAEVPFHQFRCQRRMDIGTIRELRAFIADQKIDIVHSHGYKADIYSWLCGGEAIRISTCHNWITPTARMSFYAFLDRLFLRRFQAVIAVSEPVRAALIEAGIAPERVVLVDNGIDVAKFARGEGSAIRQQFGIPKGTIVVGTVGRVGKEKGHGFLIEAMREVCQERQDVVLLIVGDGAEKETLEARVRRELPGGKVIFAGKRTDVPNLLAAMDIFVLPSLVEGHPMVLLEAMAAGRPIIASEVGAVRSILGDGSCGIIVPAGDSKALASAVAGLLTNREKASEYGSQAQTRVNKHYSSYRMAAHYVTIYDEARRQRHEG